MYEVEAKVPLNKTDFQRLKKEISSLGKRKERVEILDRYYGSPNLFYLRVREKNKKIFLHLKNKERGEGIEYNQEVELPLTSASGFDRFLKKNSIPLYTSKKKLGELFTYGDFQIELHQVTGLGYFLEIETLVESKAAIPQAKRALRKLFKQLGFSPKDFERKYYLELLEEKRKNNSR